MLSWTESSNSRRRCGVARIWATILWNLPIAPRERHLACSWGKFCSSSAVACSAASASLMKVSKSAPRRNALTARLMIWPKHRERLPVSLSSWNSLANILIALSILPALSPMYTPILSLISNSETSLIISSAIFSPWWTPASSRKPRRAWDKVRFGDRKWAQIPTIAECDGDV